MFNIDELLLLPLSISIYAVLLPLLTMLTSLAQHVVERDRVSDQEIALVSSKSTVPEKIEVALIKKKKEGAKTEPWALLEGSLFCRSLCTCHPDSILAFFSRKRTADKNPL